MPVRRLHIRPGAIGDVILSLPALLAAKAQEVWTPTALVSVLQLAGFSKIRPIPTTGLDLVGVRGGAELCPALRDFDEIISWYGANNDAFRTAVRDLPFQFLDALPPKDSTVNAADFFLHQIQAPIGGNPSLAIESSRANYAVIHPFSGSAQKNWPLSRYKELAASLDLEVRWVAGPEQHLDSATLFEDLADLAGFLAAARIYVGNDSGITHLAAATGTPTVAIFGPTDPRVWAPRGAHVRVVKPPNRASMPDAGLEDVGLEKVLQVVRSLLSLH